MKLKTLVAALAAASFMAAGCGEGEPPGPTPEVKSSGLVPDGAKKIEGAGGGGVTESAK